MTPEEIADAIDAAKARWDHGEAIHDPDALALIRAAEKMFTQLYGHSDTAARRGMPVFPIQAKDRLAIDALMAYEKLCHFFDLEAQAGQTAKASAEFFEWRMNNRDLVKAPDHPHVPVTTTDAGGG